MRKREGLLLTAPRRHLRSSRPSRFLGTARDPVAIGLQRAQLYKQENPFGEHARSWARNRKSRVGNGLLDAHRCSES